MVMDFGFIKQIMMEEIHDPIDHGIVLYNKDADVLSYFPGRINCDHIGACDKHPYSPWLKLYLLDAPPTAEVMAEHWFQRLRVRVDEFTQGQARLKQVLVWETPNSVAIYPPE